MALEYTLQDGTVRYVRIDKIKSDNDDKLTKFSYSEHEHMDAPLQQDPATTIQVLGAPLNTSRSSFNTVDAQGNDLFAHAYSLLMALPEYAGAVAV